LPSESPVRKVLIYRLGSLGDTVVALPCLHLIARLFPNAERRLLTNFPVHAKAPASAAVLGDSGLVHGYMRYTAGTRNPLELLRLAGEIRRFKPDLLVYLMFVRPWSSVVRDRMFFCFAGARRIVGIHDEKTQKHRFNEATGLFEREAARLARLINELGDAHLEDPASWDLHLNEAERHSAAGALAPLAGGPLIVCGPGTKMQSKDWGQDNWRALLSRLHPAYADHALALIGAQEEAELSEFAAQDWTGPKINLCGRLTPRETAAVIERAKVFLGPDSGPMHLAASVGVPCVIAFSAAGTPGAWFPPGPDHRVVYHRTSCNSCHLQTCTIEGRRCLTSISVDEMAAAAGTVLDGHELGSSPGQVFSLMTNEPARQHQLMRVLLVANFGPDAQGSMSRYAAWLERTLKSRGHFVTVILPQPFFSRLGWNPTLRKYLGYLDKFVLFPPRLRRPARDHDLVHILDHSNSMYLRMVRQKPNLITCHDVLAIRAARGEFPQSPTGWSGRLLQRWILSGLRGASHVLCVSAKTADDLKALTADKVEAGKSDVEMRVIYNALNWSYRPGAELPDGLISRLGLRAGERFVLHVGGNLWYKNRPGVLRIFARLVRIEEFSDLKLVMVGQPWTDDMREVVREEQLSDHVIEAVDVTNPELQALYGNALALLFPSLEEGFGWPIVEAQACGCPVITTMRTPMTEVAGNGAILIDPGDADAAAAAIARGLNDREKLQAEGFRNLERFDHGAIAEQYCAFYEAILRSEIGP
jgi:heptosyltransferase-3